MTFDCIEDLLEHLTTENQRLRRRLAHLKELDLLNELGDNPATPPIFKLPLPDNSVKTFCVDYPWQFDDHNKKMNGWKGSKKYRLHPNYTVAPIEVLGPVLGAEINRTREEKSHLYMWTVKDFYVEAHQMATNWGWEYKTTIPWVKTYKNDTPVCGPGYYFRGCIEYLLFFVSTSRDNKTLNGPRVKNLLWEEGELPTLPDGIRAPNPPAHSEKPPIAYEMICEQSPGPRVAIFEHYHRPGFVCIGDNMEPFANLNEAVCLAAAELGGCDD